ncbi:MAG: ribonuclease III [Bacteroidaceae bacterium]|nr:ribonuclease III [Bacteroidaceae bacterium]
MTSVFQGLKQNVRLLFRKDKEPYFRVRRITGFLPNNLGLYRTALRHKSVSRTEDGRSQVNNERLEYLGDAVLGAVVADILYERYPNKQEGFLTTLRSKLVRRDMLNQIAVQIGLDKLVLHEGPVTSAHNSYMNGNAFEAFVGALYLDRGYAACQQFVRRVILRKFVNIEELAKKEENYKSRLIEWCQKHQLECRFEIISQKLLSDHTTPKFVSRVTIEDVYCGQGEGFSKKESHQQAARQAYHKVRRDVAFVNSLIDARNNHKQQTPDA